MNDSNKLRLIRKVLNGGLSERLDNKVPSERFLERGVEKQLKRFFREADDISIESWEEYGDEIVMDVKFHIEDLDQNRGEEYRYVAYYNMKTKFFSVGNPTPGVRPNPRVYPI